MTIHELIQDCVQDGLGLPADPIQSDVYNRALRFVNNEAQKIWDAWPWDNTKIDEFTSPTPDSDGIITFASNVDVIRAVRTTTSGDTGVRVFNQDEIQAAQLGQTVSGDRFIYLAADTGTTPASRRIQVADEDATYKILATFRFTPYTTVTALTDTFPIDKAEQALKANVCDELRIWDGEPPKGQGPGLLAMANAVENETADREVQMTPRHPMFNESDSWY